MVVRCPAKLNLFLSVGPRDARGYHPIRTVFQAINLWDDLTLEVAETPSFSCNWEALPKENTIMKALRLANEITRVPPLKIELKKRIPDQSGLGGGSSDAAGMLRALKQWDPGIGDAELRSVAKAVGMDVPFFLIGGTARAEGYGERLTALPDSARRWFVIARPEVGCSTSEMYRRLDELHYEWRGFPEDPSEVYNDFERVAPCECLELIETLRGHGALRTGLSGSGSAVFGVFGDQTHAQRVCELVHDARACRCWVARSLDRAESIGSPSSL